MTNTTLINTQMVIDIAPGHTIHSHFNNTAPVQAVWSINDIPVSCLQGTSDANQHSSMKVVRFWRHFTMTEKKSSPQS